MSAEIWLCIITCLVTLIGALASLGYRDITRRIKHLESQNSVMNAAIVTILLTKTTDPETVAKAVHELLIQMPISGD